MSLLLQSKKKTREPKEENITLGPAVREGEHVFGVAHIFASFNDTFIVSFVLIVLHVICMISGYNVHFLFILQHVTDLSGRETLVRITGMRSFL